MKKYTMILSTLVISISSVYAGNGNAQKPSSGAQQNGSMQMTMPDCSKLSASEQNFANQLTDMNNKSMFCSQFSPQQRQQAMQMMGQPDASGNTMSADQAVQQVMRTAPGQRRTGGACPMK